MDTRAEEGMVRKAGRAIKILVCSLVPVTLFEEVTYPISQRE